MDQDMMRLSRTFQSPSYSPFQEHKASAFQTPIQQARGSHHHPYARPVASSSPTFFPEPSPYDGLSKKQRKAFKAETKRIDNQVKLWPAVIADLYKESPDRNAIVASLARVCDIVSETRTFSSLTTKDYNILNPGEMGLITCVNSALVSTISPERIPTDFWPSLQTLRRTYSRRMEMGVRQIIGHFLAYAVDIARGLFNMDRLVVHTEIEVPEVEIPRIGKVHGPLDYLTCPAGGYLPMGPSFNEQELIFIR